jgi:hypothetical protein
MGGDCPFPANRLNKGVVISSECQDQHFKRSAFSKNVIDGTHCSLLIIQTYAAITAGKITAASISAIESGNPTVQNGIAAKPAAIIVAKMACAHQRGVARLSGALCEAPIRKLTTFSVTALFSVACFEAAADIRIYCRSRS